MDHVISMASYSPSVVRCRICGAVGLDLFCATHDREWLGSPQYQRFVDLTQDDPRRSTMLADFVMETRLVLLNACGTSSPTEES